MSLFVTGTDTGVGKTYVTRLILETLRNEGIDAVGYKPIACGDRDDARILAAASGGLSEDEVNPLHLQTPVAPYVAGLLENKCIDPAEILAGYHRLASAHDHVIVEGAGGWEVPISANYRMSDLAKDLGLPVLVVAANRLGALNHTLLTVDAIRAKGLSCAGIILNQLDDELDTAMITNKGVIEDLSGISLLDHLIKNQDFLDPAILDLFQVPRD
ncbi:MAG: dethiobiotin synthase [Akkermansiaceae bacterium]|jgi:dethiobiotin synthetase|nr:dethiobiotin synthase [Akkermansiaceae bacterium]